MGSTTRIAITPSHNHTDEPNERNITIPNNTINKSSGDAHEKRLLALPPHRRLLCNLTSGSPIATLILSAVAGDTKWKESFSTSCFSPYCTLAAEIACLSAKNTELPKNSGGSPIPLLDWIVPRCLLCLGRAGGMGPAP